ncbi:MAG: hypothetical protein RL468_2064 [Pseudomonadota bacterium]|jgi:hypothetical protein
MLSNRIEQLPGFLDGTTSLGNSPMTWRAQQGKLEQLSLMLGRPPKGVQRHRWLSSVRACVPARADISFDFQSKPHQSV